MVAFSFATVEVVKENLPRLTMHDRFHGAYSTVLEGEPLHEVFGDMDVVAPTLPDMADKIIAATQ